MRLGLLGAGFIGRTHLRVAKAVSAIKIVGYVDPHVRADHPDLVDLRRYDTLATMLGDVDGVIIAVPDDLHVTSARQCLDRGVAVFLEKPAARSLDECMLLAQAPNVATRLLVGHQRRHHPATRWTKAALERGDLGRLIGLGGVFAVRKDDQYFIDRSRGVGLVNLIHDIDLLQYFCGPISHVSAEVSHKARGAREEDTIALVFAFESGVVGSFIATDSVPSPWGWDQATTELPSIPFNMAGTTYALLGTEGSLSVPDLRLHKHRTGEAWHHSLIHEDHRTTGGNAYVNQLAHFVDVALGHARPLVGITEAIATQAALDAVFISAREGRRTSTRALIDAATARVASAKADQHP